MPEIDSEKSVMYGFTRLIFFTVLSLAPLLVQAQSPAREGKATGSISGTVKVAGKPASGFKIVALQGQLYDLKVVAVTSTDGNGHFHLQGVPAGSCQVTVDNPSFSISKKELAEDQTDITKEDEADEEEDSPFNMLSALLHGTSPQRSVTVEAGEEIRGIDFALLPGGVITGRVSEVNGRPLIGEVVHIEPANSRDDSMSIPMALRMMIETDDRGIYRFYGLWTSSYLVFVNRTGQFADERFRNEAAIYYPSASRDNAKEVKVTVGQEVSGIDIRYRSERGHIVSGKVSGPLGKEEMLVRLKLLNAKRKTIEAEELQIDEENRAFAFYGVPDGDYYLVAENKEEEPYRASLPTPASVKGRGVTGIDLSLTPFASIAGRVRFATSAAKCGASHPTPVEELRVCLIPYENAGDALRFAEAAVDSDGAFALTNLAPGRYLLFIRASGDQNEVAAKPLAAFNSNERAQLQRAAEAFNLAIDLQRCQRMEGHKLSYPLKAQATAVEPLPDSQAKESLTPQPALRKPQPATKKNPTKKRRPINP